MKQRKSIFSESAQDGASSLFLIVIVPFVFYYEVDYVFDELHYRSRIYYMNLFLGSFIVFNIIANLLHMMVVDTSIHGSDDYKTSARTKTDKSTIDWHYCEICEVFVPPGAWHCPTCNVCILKRENHCMFASNCIGLYNHRYYVALLAYIFIGTSYCLFYNSYYVWIRHAFHYRNWMTPVKMVFPMYMIYTRRPEMDLYAYMLVIIGTAYSGALLFHHLKELRYETGKSLKQNIKMIFGEDPLYTFLWPFAATEVDETYWLEENSKEI